MKRNWDAAPTCTSILQILITPGRMGRTRIPSPLFDGSQKSSEFQAWLIHVMSDGGTTMARSFPTAPMEAPTGAGEQISPRVCEFCAKMLCSDLVVLLRCHICQGYIGYFGPVNYQIPKRVHTCLFCFTWPRSVDLQAQKGMLRKCFARDSRQYSHQQPFGAINCHY